MKTFAFIFSLVICGGVIFMTELSRDEYYKKEMIWRVK